MPKGSAELTRERQEEIIAACRKLYETMSFKEITLKEIGSRTTFSRTSIYNYFETKEEIFLALFAREYELFSLDLDSLRERESALSLDELASALARALDRAQVRAVFAVGVPSAILTGLFDLASICVNILAAAHSDLVLAGMGIVLKVERIPNAVNIGICQGMMPIIAYNYTSGDHARMKETIRTARLYGLIVSGVSILLLEIFASPVTKVFLSTSTENSRAAIVTVGLAALFLRIRALASPVQFINYHTSFCMQAIGKGGATILHAMVRELVFYIPLMFILDRLFGYVGLASALPAGEALGAVFALVLLRRILKKSQREL